MPRSNERPRLFTSLPNLTSAYGIGLVPQYRPDRASPSSAGSLSDEEIDPGIVSGWDEDGSETDFINDILHELRQDESDTEVQYPGSNIIAEHDGESPHNYFGPGFGWTSQWSQHRHCRGCEPANANAFRRWLDHKYLDLEPNYQKMVRDSVGRRGQRRALAIQSGMTQQRNERERVAEEIEAANRRNRELQQTLARIQSELQTIRAQTQARARAQAQAHAQAQSQQVPIPAGPQNQTDIQLQMLTIPPLPTFEHPWTPVLAMPEPGEVSANPRQVTRLPSIHTLLFPPLPTMAPSMRVSAIPELGPTLRPSLENPLAVTQSPGIGELSEQVEPSPHS
ncbi:uncharacterized protein BDZ99DRAFT_513412 [Mytilinidion resinicola]|uniref:Uncharacterized protein n=1 Tax=Mytilinidion resinicola TaxID=574789 RepID=A0A6A6Z8N1_9PEZI|nr:uncharacterized protein BDZ99DRAFT_513412 [Mytilinidion resinicola]KAF2817158.1 hypothetical protein BDZ99DRAFT_513412 [Mytilinidion resinicola]